MPTPFPGMDPYLEQPDLWPDVHNSLITALRDDLAPKVRSRYYLAIEEPEIELGRLLHDLYDRAGYDMRLDYGAGINLPLVEEDAAWVDRLLKETGRR